MQNNRFVWAIFLAGFFLSVQSNALAVGTCIEMPDAWANMESRILKLTGPNNKSVEFESLIADESWERAAGYQYICQANTAGSAILFIFPNPVNSRFHMRNVFVDLDIAFINSQGEVDHIMHMRAEPPGVPVMPRLYGPKEAFSFALEAPAGAFANYGISVQGWRLDTDKLALND